MAEEVRRGGCLCGAVRYEVRGRLRQVVLCHCGQCRRWSGNAVAATRARKRRFALTEDRGLAWYDSSPDARRGFCRLCGSSLFWERRDGDRISILAGSLDDAGGLDSVAHVHVAEKAGYERLDDQLPRLPGGGSDEFLPPEALEDDG